MENGPADWWVRLAIARSCAAMGGSGLQIGRLMSELGQNAPTGTQVTAIRGVAGVQTPAFVERGAAGSRLRVRVGWCRRGSDSGLR